MYLILFAVFIDLVGFGLIFPLLPFITAEFGGSTLAGAGLISIYSLMAFVSGPLWGRLSDRIGRRPALMMTFMGGASAYLVFALADNMTMLFVSRALAGAMAGNVGIVMAAMADLTDEKTRGKAMGLIGAAFALGFAFGPGIGALLANITGETSTLVPGLVAVTLSVSAAILTGLFMPETNPDKTEADLEEPIVRSVKSGAIVKSTPASVQAFGKTPLWRQVIYDRRSFLLILMIGVMAIGQSVHFTMMPYWFKAVHNWDVEDVGLLMMSIGFLVAIIQSRLLGPMFDRFGEIGTMLGGCALFTASSALLWFGEGRELFSALAFTMLVSGLTVSFPAMNSILSVRTNRSIQGSALGLSNGVAALGRVVGPLTGGAVFSALNPTRPFLAVTTVGMIAILWCLWEKRQGALVATSTPVSTLPDTEK